MKSKAGILLLLLVSVALLRCSDDSITGNSIFDQITPDKVISDLSEDIVIGYNRTVLIEEEHLLIKFKDVTEGRCPFDVDCFWEGQATCEFLLLKPNGDHGTAKPIIRPGVNPDSDEFWRLAGEALGYRVYLLALNPYPHIYQTIDPKDYVAKLRVEKLSDCREDRICFTETRPFLLQKDRVIVHSAVIRSDILTLTVLFSGGCGDHKFKLFMGPGFMESHPVQANLYLQHTDLGDPCDAIVSEDVSFDIRPIAELYKDMYGSYYEIILNVYGYFADEPKDKIRISYIPGKP